MAHLYPSEVPVSEVKRILQALRTGDPFGNLPLFAHDVYTVQGYLMGITIGDPDGPAPMFSGGPTVKNLTKEEAIKCLQAIDKDGDDEKREAFGALPFDYKSLLRWLVMYLAEAMLK